MAVTNHERVGRALTLLGQGLAPFVERECKARWGDAWVQQLLGAAPGAGTGKFNVADPAFLLKAMGDSWQMVFRHVLGHAERSYVSEVREFRNSWAHQSTFSTDDAERALDSIRRL